MCNLVLFSKRLAQAFSIAPATMRHHPPSCRCRQCSLASLWSTSALGRVRAQRLASRLWAGSSSTGESEDDEGRDICSRSRSPAAAGTAYPSSTPMLAAISGTLPSSPSAPQSAASPWVPPSSLAGDGKLEARWRAAQEACERERAAASQHGSIYFLDPMHEVTAEAVKQRVWNIASGSLRSSSTQSFYVGSTSSPSWRWAGGKVWREPSGARSAPCAAPSYMQGHCKNFSLMCVIGAWPDSRTAELEPLAIAAGRHFGHRCANKADDARGLAVRPFAYSFLYVCTVDPLDQLCCIRQAEQPPRRRLRSRSSSLSQHRLRRRL